MMLWNGGSRKAVANQGVATLSSAITKTQKWVSTTRTGENQYRVVAWEPEIKSFKTICEGAPRDIALPLALRTRVRLGLT